MVSGISKRRSRVVVLGDSFCTLVQQFQDWHLKESYDDYFQYTIRFEPCTIDTFIYIESHLLQHLVFGRVILSWERVMQGGALGWGGWEAVLHLTVIKTDSVK